MTAHADYRSDDRPGYRLAADLAEGTRDGRPPLVLLHGLTFDRAMWQPALSELGKIDPGRQVLALDLPGHGGSPPWPGYDIDSVTEAVHDAVRQARLDAPVLVGHSMSAVIATVYAARYPARAVVNVDQWLQLAPALTLARSLAGQIRGDSFASAWQVFEDSMHTEMLPASARKLLRPASSVRREVVAGYWRPVLDGHGEELTAQVETALAAIRAKGTGYLFIAGHRVEPEYRAWLGHRLPQARTEVFPDSGHFPHLAHPARFAACLTANAAWNTAARGGAG